MIKITKKEKRRYDFFSHIVVHIYKEYTILLPQRCNTFF